MENFIPILFLIGIVGWWVISARAKRKGKYPKEHQPSQAPIPYPRKNKKNLQSTTEKRQTSPNYYTSDAVLSKETLDKLTELVKTDRKLMKFELREMFPNDFEWPEYDKWKSYFDKIGYKSYLWTKMSKLEMLIHTMTSVRAEPAHEEEYPLSTAATEYVEMLVDDDACDICKAFKGKIFTIDKAPVPCRDTHLGCRCDLIPILED